MDIGSIICLCVFFVSTSVHLYASAKKNAKLRGFTKVFIVLSLIFLYIFATRFLGREVRVIVILALFFSWLGDVLLIPSSIKLFALGGISFWASHVCFILAYNEHIVHVVPLWVIIAVAIPYIVVVIWCFIKLKPHLPKLLFWPMLIYLLTNGAMNCFAFYQMYSQPCLGTIITYCGALLFFISDALLFFTRFNKQTKLKTHFPVMLAYSLGELLLTIGLIIY